MTDEQLGRAWCQKNGKVPYRNNGFAPKCEPFWGFSAFGGWSPMWERHTLPLIPAKVMGDLHFPTESDAYVAVGAALRKVLALADEVRAMEGQQLPTSNSGGRGVRLVGWHRCTSRGRQSVTGRGRGRSPTGRPRPCR